MSQKIPTSLIVLKHTITEGRVPTPDILEVGEVALGLFKGQESIWSKNNTGEIVNFRSPRHDLMWGDLFLKYNTRTEFVNDLNLGKVKNTSIVFIIKEKLLWTDGIFYNSSYDEKELESIVSNYIIKIPESVYNLNSESTSDDILSAFKTIDNFKKIAIKAKEGSLSSLTYPEGGSIPTSVISNIKSEESIELSIEYIINGNFTQQIITLEENIFSVNNNSLNLRQVNTRINELDTRISKIETGEFDWTEINNNNN